MPYKSEKQRRFMALVHSLQSGKVKKKDVGKKVEDAATSMTKTESHDFMVKKEGKISAKSVMDPELRKKLAHELLLKEGRKGKLTKTAATEIKSVRSGIEKDPMQAAILPIMDSPKSVMALLQMLQQLYRSQRYPGISTTETRNGRNFNKYHPVQEPVTPNQVELWKQLKKER